MLDLLARLLPRVPDNRIVAFVMPLVTPPVAVISGVAATWLTEHVPGVHVTTGQATAFGLATATFIVVHSIDGARQWFKGHLKQIPAAAGGLVDAEVDDVTRTELPTDQEELHATDSPPSGVILTEPAPPVEDPPRQGPPVQPSQTGAIAPPEPTS